MTLPAGVKALETLDEVKAAWGDQFVVTLEDGTEEVLFARNPKVAIAVDGVYVQLRRPVKAGPDLELTDVLFIPEPTVNHVRMTDRYKGEVEKGIAMLSSLCGIPTEGVNKMSASDMVLCGAVVGAFL